MLNFKLASSGSLPVMRETHNCPYHRARLATVQGLSSHLTQSQRQCQARHRASFINSDSSDDQPQDDNQNAENLPEGIPMDYDSDFASLPRVNPEPMIDASESLEEQDEPRRILQSRRASVED